MTPEISVPKLQLPPDRPPMFVSAGLVKNEPQIYRYTGIQELAVQVIGSFSDKENIPPGEGRIFYYDEENKTAYNAFRLRNPGREAASEYLPEAIDAVHDAGQLAIISVTPLKHENPLKVIPDLVEWALLMGADGVEINTSCPNEDSDELLCRDVAKTKHMIDLARERVGSAPYLMLKVSAMGEAIIRQYKNGLKANGISPINSERMLSPQLPGGEGRAIEVNEGYGGQSGQAINKLARKNLRSWLRPATGPANFPVEDPQYDVWSVGGIEDGYEGYHRVHDIGAFAFGGAQDFYKAPHPAPVAARWDREYTEALEAAA